MNIQTAKRQAQLQKWITIIQKCNQSGMKIIDFCTSEGITKDAYYYWLRKVREAALESQTDVSVVTEIPKLVNITKESMLSVEKPTMVNNNSGEMIAIANPNPIGFTTQLTISLGSSVIGVNQNTPKELLLSVMEVLKNV